MWEGGDIGEKAEHLRTVFELTCQLFHTVIWTPGNHELYTLPSDENGLRGEMKYKECVAIANEYGVITPEVRQDSMALTVLTFPGRVYPI